MRIGDRLRRVVFCILVFGLVLPYGAQAGQVLKVLTLNFNAEIFPVDHDQLMREQRYARMLDWIKANDPDVITLQEAWDFRGDPMVGITLAHQLGYDLSYSLDMGSPGIMYNGSAVLTRKSLRMSDAQDKVLPHSAAFSGDRKKWVMITGAVTVGVGATIHLADGSPVYVYTGHLVGDSDDQRKDQLVALHQMILDQLAKDHGDPARARLLITGDLNSAPTDPSIQFLLGDLGFSDTWALAHPDLWGTPAEVTNCSDPTSPYYDPYVIGAGQFPSQTGPGSRACSKIDYVAMKGPAMRVLSSTVIFSGPYENVWMSDHNGVFSQIEIGDATGAKPANPARDAADDAFGKPAVVDITPTLVNDCGFSDGCSRRLRDVTVEPFKGLAILNDTHMKIVAHLTGPGKILTQPDAAMDAGGAAGFVFTQPGDYDYRITDENHDYFIGTIHVIE